MKLLIKTNFNDWSVLTDSTGKVLYEGHDTPDDLLGAVIKAFETPPEEQSTFTVLHEVEIREVDFEVE